MKQRISLPFLTLLLLLSGCAYSFKGQGIGGIKSIAVDQFNDVKGEFGVPQAVREAVIRKLLSDRTLNVVPTANADAILTGTIVTIDDRPLTYMADRTVSEYEVSITIELALTKQGQGDPIWHDRLSGAGSYPYSTGSDERQKGLDKALDKIVQDMLNRLTSDW